MVRLTRATVHPIEQRSFAVLRSRVDLTHLAPLTRAVVERVVHASADLSYVEDLVLDEASLRRGRRALADGARVVTDVQMVAAGITAVEAVCRVREASAHEGRHRSGEKDRRGQNAVEHSVRSRTPPVRDRGGLNEGVDPAGQPEEHPDGNEQPVSGRCQRHGGGRDRDAGHD